MSLVRWVALVALVWTPVAVSKDASLDAGKDARPKFKYALEIDRERRMVLADQKRDELIAQLENDIIPKFEADHPQRPDLLFQLSEYYWEKFRFLYAQEEQQNDQAYQRYQARLTAGEKNLTAPKVDHRESEQHRARTMALYEEILSQHPKFEKTDQVLFSLGSNLQDLSDAKQDPQLRSRAAQRYEELIKRYPQSRLVPDTYVQLGDYYFDNNKLEQATANFQKALRSKVPKIYSYALYKLAWCDFNYNAYEKGLAKLHQVVDYAQSHGQGMVDLRNEALADAVLFYTKLDQPNQAVAYFNSKAEEPRRSKLVAKLGGQLSEAGYYDHSTQVFKKLISEDPMRPQAPAFQEAIVANFEQLRQRDSVKKEVKALAETYRPGGEWWKANLKDRTVLREAFSVGEEATRKIVTEYHTEAQKTDQVNTYRLTRDLYRQYITAFSTSEDPEFVSDYAFNMMFYYAQILWGLEEWEASADAYDRVVAFKVPDRPEARDLAKEEYRKIAAFSAILAYDKLIKIERGELTATVLKDGQKIREDKDKGGMSKLGKGIKRDVRAQPVALTRFEQKMVAASDAYARLDPALREQKDEVEIRANAALIYFDKNHFPEAEKRFAELISRWPEEERAREAADLTMFVMEGQERWEELRDASARFLTNAKLAKPGSEFAQRVGGVLEGSSYKWIDEVVNKKNQQPLVAAEQFLKFVEAYPKAKTADRAMTYAMLLFRDAGQLDRAILTGERALQLHSGSPLEPKVRFTLAKLYEVTADFQRSAQMNEAFLASQDRRRAAFESLKKKLQEAKGKKASEETVKELTERKATEEELLKESESWVADARFNAGLWWEGLGQHEKAVASFRGYLKQFPDRADAPAIALRVASLYEKDQKWSEANRAYADFQQRYAKKAEPAQQFQARYGQLNVLRQAGRKGEAERAETELVRAWTQLPAPAKEELSALTHYAQARFAQVEPRFVQFQQIKLNRLGTLQRDLKAKQKRLAELEKAYVEVISLGAGTQAIAALTRIGLAYEDLAKNILESPTPRGLDEEQEAMYRGEIEGLAAPVEEKAIEAFEKALEKSYELKLYSDWVFQAQEKLNSYRPGAYAQVRQVEFRGAEYLATSPIVREPAGAGAMAVDPQLGAPPASGKQPEGAAGPEATTPTAMGGAL